MNFFLPHIPERTKAPRSNGMTMMMDKGLSLRETEDFLSSSAEFCDFVKFGFGSSMITNNLEKKIALYHEAGMRVYLGGTLFEAFIARNMFDDYRKLLTKLKLQNVEVSDGSIFISHKKKCDYIKQLAQDFTVLSEVGSKEEGILISPAKWVKMMSNELKAGSWKVIAEARESGNVGIYRPNGSAHSLLVSKILAQINSDDILWEAPQKSQQVWFIKLIGPNVNLGNIAPNDMIALETLRLGLRGDTFFDYLPDDVSERMKQMQ
jgi:phosphosulfolactate synthase